MLYTFMTKFIISQVPEILNISCYCNIVQRRKLTNLIQYYRVEGAIIVGGHRYRVFYFNNIK